jgi:hypothetical protein
VCHLKALSSDKELFGQRSEEDSGPKISMKKLFERPKVKIDGTPSKVPLTRGTAASAAA